MIPIQSISDFTHDYLHLGRNALEEKYKAKFTRIMAFALKNNIFRRKWSPKDKNQLKMDYLTMNKQQLETKYKRSYTAIQRMAERVGSLKIRKN